MAVIIEDELSFSFPNGWEVSKFDQWSFYRNQFMRIGEASITCKECKTAVRCAGCNNKRIAGSKGIDILALSMDSVCWLIEIKDYRLTRVTDFAFLADVVALKVRDTHACLVAARLNANDNIERDRATRALGCASMRVVLHLESPRMNSRAHSPATQRANVLQRLKQLVKAVDARPLVLSMNDVNGIQWTVKQV
jgi:hypothetical protein